jgi:hypothetical protein
MKFIENDNITTNEKEKAAENFMKDRKEKELKIKTTDNKI